MANLIEKQFSKNSPGKKMIPIYLSKKLDGTQRDKANVFWTQVAQFPNTTPKLQAKPKPQMPSNLKERKT